MSTKNDKPAPAGTGSSLFQKIRKVLRVLVAIFGGRKHDTDKKDSGTPGGGQGGSAKP